MRDLIDKKAVRKSFDNAAPTYDSYAGLQQDIACSLLSLCKRYVTAPQHVLDIGSGTGYGVRLLCRHFSPSTVIGLDFSHKMLQKSMSSPQYQDKIRYVCADADFLPFPESVFDLIYSSSFIQWSSDPSHLFRRYRESLKDQGWLCFSSFGPKTLFEIRESWQAVDSEHHTLGFISAEQLIARLEQEGFWVESCKRGMRVIHHQGVNAALQSIKNIGAQNHLRKRKRGLTTPRQYHAMSEAYQKKFGVQGLVPTTYEILLLIARRV